MAHKEANEDVKLLREKLKDIRIAMMTSIEKDGTLRSRPMATQEIEDDGSLWFFTYADAPKVDEVEEHQQVNINYSKPDKNLFVAISGAAQLVRDRKKIKELWKPLLKAWFPDGEDDPQLALLHVQVEQAEIWDSPSGKAGSLLSTLKALTTKAQDPGGQDIKLDMK